MSWMSWLSFASYFFTSGIQRHPQRNLQQQIDLQGVWNTKQRVLGSWPLRNLPRSKDFGGISFWIQNSYINSRKKKCCYWPQNVLVLNIKQQSLCIDVILGESLAWTCLTCLIGGEREGWSCFTEWCLVFGGRAFQMITMWEMKEKPGRFIIMKVDDYFQGDWNEPATSSPPNLPIWQTPRDLQRAPYKQRPEIWVSNRDDHQLWRENLPQIPPDAQCIMVYMYPLVN